jgi:hypothetical protein
MRLKRLEGAAPGEDNPMNPASRARAILKKLLYARAGFGRGGLQGCLNLFSSASNPPVGLLEKVELMIKMAFAYPKTLRCRDFFPGIKGF